MKAIIYLRVSTQMQADEGVSLDAQEAKARAWALLNDYEVDRVFIDAGISGRKMNNRTGLQDALNACGKGDALVVYSLSRLSRSLKDTLSISEKLNKNGTDLVSISEKIDTTSAAGRMIFKLMAVMAEFESEQLSERTKEASNYKKSKGERVGSIPYGYKLGEDKKTLVKDDVEQEIIEVVNRLRKNGLSLLKIGEYLHDHSYQPRGNKWHAQTIKNILAA